MGLLGADLFAQTDGAHLQETGSEFTDRLGMSFRPSQHDDSVGFAREPIYMGYCAVACWSKFASLHSRPNGSPDSLLPYSESVQNLGLSFRGGAAVTTHCRN